MSSQADNTNAAALVAAFKQNDRDMEAWRKEATPMVSALENDLKQAGEIWYSGQRYTSIKRWCEPALGIKYRAMRYRLTGGNPVARRKKKGATVAPDAVRVIATIKDGTVFKYKGKLYRIVGGDDEVFSVRKPKGSRNLVFTFAGRPVGKETQTPPTKQPKVPEQHKVKKLKAAETKLAINIILGKIRSTPVEDMTPEEHALGMRFELVKFKQAITEHPEWCWPTVNAALVRILKDTKRRIHWAKEEARQAEEELKARAERVGTPVRIRLTSKAGIAEMQAVTDDTSTWVIETGEYVSYVVFEAKDYLDGAKELIKRIKDTDVIYDIVCGDLASDDQEIDRNLRIWQMKNELDEAERTWKRDMGDDAKPSQYVEHLRERYEAKMKLVLVIPQCPSEEVTGE